MNVIWQKSCFISITGMTENPVICLCLFNSICVCMETIQPRFSFLVLKHTERLCIWEAVKHNPLPFPPFKYLPSLLLGYGFIMK